jgi:predicted PurR-regulated permease PerM
MDNSDSPTVAQGLQTRQIIHTALQLLALGFLLVWCFEILAPFGNIVLWAAILALALFPLHQWVKRKCKGRGTLAAILICVTLLGLFISSGVWLALKTSNEIQSELGVYKQGKIVIPPPPAKIKDWPLIGEKLDKIWNQTSIGLDNLVQEHPEQVKAIASKSVDMLASTGKGLLIILVSIIISGIFLSYAEQSANFARTFFSRIISCKQIDMASVAAVTIRNVVKGILGLPVSKVYLRLLE